MKALAQYSLVAAGTAVARVNDIHTYILEDLYVPMVTEGLRNQRIETINWPS